jgi:hypothetical protein
MYLFFPIRYDQISKFKQISGRRHFFYISCSFQESPVLHFSLQCTSQASEQHYIHQPPVAEPLRNNIKQVPNFFFLHDECQYAQ